MRPRRGKGEVNRCGIPDLSTEECMGASVSGHGKGLASAQVNWSYAILETTCTSESYSSLSGEALAGERGFRPGCRQSV